MFDAEGTRASQVNSYDDGRVLETVFVDGLHASAVMQDIEDAHAWSSYTNSYDDAGVLTHRSWVYDDGRSAETS